MDEHKLQFSALVGARICHDLISPIGAINNGMELLSMSGAPQSPEIELIAQSVDAANARIRFFRIAYGATSTEQFLGRSEITSILRDFTKGSRLVLNWHPLEDVTRSEVQLVFLAIQCAEQALPYGGHVEIERQRGRWSLSLSGERISLDQDLWDSLAGISEFKPEAYRETIPAHVQFLLLPMHARDLDRTPNYTQSETEVTLLV